MIRERISKFGREQIEAAKEIIICKSNPWAIAKFGERSPQYNPDHYIAMVIYKNGNNDLVHCGDLGTWRFDSLKNGIRSIKRINKDVPIKIYSDDEITKFIAIEKAEMASFMNAVKKFNSGDKTDLISILKEDNHK